MGGPFMAVFQLQDLSEQQKADIRAVLDQQRNGADPQRDRGLDLQHRLMQAVFADTPDTAAIVQLKQQIAAADADALAARIDVQTRIAQILTSEQRRTLRDRPLPQHSEMRGRRPGRPERG